MSDICRLYVAIRHHLNERFEWTYNKDNKRLVYAEKSRGYEIFPNATYYGRIGTGGTVAHGLKPLVYSFIIPYLGSRISNEESETLLFLANSLTFDLPEFFIPLVEEGSFKVWHLMDTIEVTVSGYDTIVQYGVREPPSWGSSTYEINWVLDRISRYTIGNMGVTAMRKVISHFIEEDYEQYEEPPLSINIGTRFKRKGRGIWELAMYFSRYSVNGFFLLVHNSAKQRKWKEMKTNLLKMLPGSVVRGADPHDFVFIMTMLVLHSSGEVERCADIALLALHPKYHLMDYGERWIESEAREYLSTMDRCIDYLMQCRYQPSDFDETFHCKSSYVERLVHDTRRRLGLPVQICDYC